MTFPGYEHVLGGFVFFMICFESHVARRVEVR